MHDELCDYCGYHDAITLTPAGKLICWQCMAEEQQDELEYLMWLEEHDDDVSEGSEQ
jgi:hypothetical protein